MTVRDAGIPAGPGRGARLARLWPRVRRPLRDALILVGLGRAAWYVLVQDIRPWEFAGVDARAYWRVDLADPYAVSRVGDVSTYLYSPAFAQLLAPAGLLPFEAFFAAWTILNLALCWWLVRPWPWVVPMLVLPIGYELLVGNVHFLLAAALVVAFRAPAAWAFPVLTKVTPGVGALWFAVRREWRALGVAVGATLAVAAASFALAPAAWAAWAGFLLGSPGRTEALPIRLAAAVALVAWGARTDRRWTVAVAAWLALPVIWVNSWVVLLATIRLARRPA